MSENLFIWSNATKKCVFGDMIEQTPGQEEGHSLVKVKITKGKIEEGTFREMFMARSYVLNQDSIGYFPS